MVRSQWSVVSRRGLTPHHSLLLLALQVPGDQPTLVLPLEAEINFRYNLGLALEASGRIVEALAQFERVFASEPNYPDVALKIRELRR